MSAKRRRRNWEEVPEDLTDEQISGLNESEKVAYYHHLSCYHADRAVRHARNAYILTGIAFALSFLTFAAVVWISR